jgi:hypothetical protein
VISRGAFVRAPGDRGPCADVGLVRHVCGRSACVFWLRARRYYVEDVQALSCLSLYAAENRARSLGVDLPVNATEIGGES